MEQSDYRFVQVLGKEQILAVWPAILNAMEVAKREPLTEGDEVQVYSDLLAGKLVAYTAFDVTAQEPKAMVILKPSPTTLHVVSFISLAQKLTRAFYGWGIEQLKKIAKARGIDNVSAMVQHETLVKLYESFGGDASTRYVRFEVNDGNGD